MANRRLKHPACTASVLACGSAAAQPAAEFYNGKQIDMFIGTPAGGGYDQYGRLLGRHMSRYIPGNPTIVFRNMPAGGGRQAMNHVYNVAPADGTAIGITHPQHRLRSAVRRDRNHDRRVEADLARQPQQRNPGLRVLAHLAVPHRRRHPQGGDRHGLERADRRRTPIHAKLINRIAGTKIRLIHGYNGSNGVHVAMERGEVQGRCGLGWDSIVSRYTALAQR